MTFRFYSYAEIKATPIGTLREFAKEIGVKSPTTLPKDALDNAVYGKIKEIEASRKIPSELDVPKSRAAVIDRSLITETDREKYGPFGKKYDERELSAFAGYFRPYKSGDGVISRGFVPSPADIFVSQSFIDGFNLISGDYVQGSCGMSENGGVKVVAYIDSVNERSIEESRSAGIEQKRKFIPFEDIDVWSDRADLRSLAVACPLKRGGRILMSHDRTVSLTDLNMRLTRHLRKQGYSVLPLFLGAMPEMESVLCEIEGATACTFDIPTEFSDYALQLLTDAAKRQAEEGRDVVVIVDNLEVCSDPALTRMLMGCACQLKKGSITMIISANEDVMDERAYKMLASFSDAAVCFERDGELYVNFPNTWVKNEWSNYPILEKFKNMSPDLVRTMIKNSETREQLEHLLK